MKTTYLCLLKMYYDAIWAAEQWNANGIASETLRYFKIAKRIEDAMWRYPATNEFRRVDG